jgi:hypothetical protein
MMIQCMFWQIAMLTISPIRNMPPGHKRRNGTSDGSGILRR